MNKDNNYMSYDNNNITKDNGNVINNNDVSNSSEIKVDDRFEFSWLMGFKRLKKKMLYKL